MQKNVAEGEGPPATKQLFTALRQIAQAYVPIQSREQVTNNRELVFTTSDLQRHRYKIITQSRQNACSHPKPHFPTHNTGWLQQMRP